MFTAKAKGASRLPAPPSVGRIPGGGFGGGGVGGCASRCNGGDLSKSCEHGEAALQPRLSLNITRARGSLKRFFV